MATEPDQHDSENQLLCKIWQLTRAKFRIATEMTVVPREPQWTLYAKWLKILNQKIP